MLTLNEVDHVPLSIGSIIDLVDEIVVLDGGSSDGTLEVLGGLGPKVKVHVMPQSGNPYSPDWQQETRRQHLEELCAGDWVMQLDSDEVVSDTFAQALPTLLTEASPETLCFGVNRLDYCPDLYHGYLPYTAHPTIPRIWRKGAITWLTGKALHMTPYLAGTTKAISSFSAPLFVPTALVLHHLHRAAWIGKSKEKRRFDEQARKSSSRASKLGTYKFELDVLPDAIVPAAIARIRSHQKQLIIDQLGIEDDFQKTCTSRIAVDAQGSFLPGSMRILEKLINELPHPLLFVEIGSSLGASTRFLAQKTGGCVIAIDPWTESMDDCEKLDLNPLSNSEQQFLRNCHAYRDRILPIRRTSMEASNLPIKDVDLLYIDGAHVVATDLHTWVPRVAPFGLVCGSGWNWGPDKPVQRAVVDFATSTGRSFKTEGNFWWLT